MKKIRGITQGRWRRTTEHSTYGPFSEGVQSRFFSKEKPPPSIRPNEDSPSDSERGIKPGEDEPVFENEVGLFRILGNDLPPRHSGTQTVDGLQHIIESEPQLAGVTKVFVVNRISDEKLATELVSMLQLSKFEFHVIPFCLEHYGATKARFDGFPTPGFFRTEGFRRESEFAQLDARTWAMREKILYAINNNGARNFALSLGQSRFRWTLPFDGQVVIDGGAWGAMLERIRQARAAKYLLFPLNRGSVIDEPQLGFRFDARERFNESIPYGRRPKLELLMRLGVPGPHESWSRFVWEPPFPRLALEAGKFINVGVVRRLESGREESDGDRITARTNSRMTGILHHLHNLDRRCVEQALSQSALGMYRTSPWVTTDSPIPLGPIASSFENAASRLEKWGYRTVLDKSEIAPSNNKNDYFSVAPYWWPVAAKRPWAKQYRDGRRVPESELFSEGANVFDRQSLYCLINSVTLRWILSGGTSNNRLRASADWVASWFGNSPTRVNPRFDSAQVMRGSIPQRNGSVLVELRDLSYFLDACTGLKSQGLISTDDWASLTSWMASLSRWMEESPLALKERNASNNLATNYYLIRLSLARFLGDTSGVVQAFNEASELLGTQLEADGTQALEMSRRNPFHYASFGLQLWCNFATVSHSCGLDFSAVSHGGQRSLTEALARHLSRYGTGLRNKQLGERQIARLEVLEHFLNAFTGQAFEFTPGSQSATLGVMEPHSGIPPGWFLMSVLYPV